MRSLSTVEPTMPDNSIYLFLADAVLFLHLLVVGFVVLGLLFVIIGGIAKWNWVRNPWFRIAHLVCIGTVVAQAWIGVICPLTTLEMWLREIAGQTTYSGSFISHWMEQLLYYDLPTWVFTAIYTVFGSVVIVTWLWVRPRPFSLRNR